MINLHISVGAGLAGPVLARPLFGDIHYIYIYKFACELRMQFYTCKQSPLNNDSTDISLWYWDNMVEAFAHL